MHNKSLKIIKQQPHFFKDIFLCVWYFIVITKETNLSKQVSPKRQEIKKKKEGILAWFYSIYIYTFLELSFKWDG